MVKEQDIVVINVIIGINISIFDYNEFEIDVLLIQS